MALTFRSALGANAVSSLLGMAMQAGTAPLLLAAFRLDQYAQWILVTAICSYLSLALNGPFYALLNEITIASTAGDRREAGAAYGLGMISVAAMFGLFSAMLAAVWLLGGAGIPASVIPILLGMLVQSAGFTAILFDASFRTVDRYRFGTNVLTACRTLDWGVSVALAFLLRDVTHVFAGLALYKLVQTILMILYLGSIPGGLLPWSVRPRLADFLRLIKAARGQVLLSASTAAASMGPQIVVSLFYSDAIIVAFSIFRTYLRLLTTGVNVLTAASWPLLNVMYGRGDFAGMERFLRRLMTRSIALASAAGLAMVAVAGPVFALLFRGKVEADRTTMLIILASVIVNCAINIDQSLFVATNMRSRALLGSLLVTLASLAFMAAAARLLPFDAILIVQVLFDMGVLFIMHRATRAIFSQRGPARGSPHDDAAEPLPAR